MNKDELIKYWLGTAEQDYNTMLNLYKSGDYHGSLFIGHIVIEKLLWSDIGDGAKLSHF